MNIELKEITIQELSDGFQDNNENGVVGFGGKLDIRPPYQREFIYKDKQRDAVINTITKNFPLRTTKNYFNLPICKRRFCISKQIFSQLKSGRKRTNIKLQIDGLRL